MIKVNKKAIRNMSRDVVLERFLFLLWTNIWWKMYNLLLNYWKVSLSSSKSRHPLLQNVGRVLKGWHSVSILFNLKIFKLISFLLRLAIIFLEREPHIFFQGHAYMAVFRLFEDHISIYCCQYFHCNSDV